MVGTRWDWLELTLDYRCNLRCLGCHANGGSGESMAAPELAARLEAGRREGIERLWLGGGEPTLRDDLPRIVAAARRLGYREILVQTNGLRLTYAKYLDALVRAGLTHVSLNLKSHRADVHDRLSGQPGVLELTLAALDAARAQGLTVLADLLVTRSTAPDLPGTVDALASRGVRGFLLWMLSATDVGNAEVTSEIPPLSVVAGPIEAAARIAEAHGATFASLHTPPCTLPGRPDLYLSAARLRMLVANPGQAPFPLERSPMEGGAWVEACDACAARPRCGGPRADYLAIHGAGDFAPLPA